MKPDCLLSVIKEKIMEAFSVVLACPKLCTTSKEFNSESDVWIIWQV